MRHVFICYAMIQLILLASSVRCDGEESDSVSTNTNSRRGSSGLISMPRIGRSDLTWAFQSQGDIVPANRKSNRGPSGLISMPRVGRAFLAVTPGVHADQYLKDKRGSSGLIPMPRVGRSGLKWPLPEALLDEDGALVSVPVKRGGDGREEPAGMWFGPRLGKRSKRSIDVPWTVFTVREVPTDIRDYTLGQEPEELEDCCDLSAEQSPTQGGRNTQIHK
ncbi:Cardio acceleratory peptide 2b [Cryptotermes secundus]|uniref:Cardio acceleratory peptide 2b n=1 Tax=Cryptotermes secundus TaxID=105785 RepID=A0A2J7Q0Z8_9NEOP|nr:cardio acceleratory peptide 2b [Cryptotermes secundus]PNF22268.1 Cardio acceleratory peptide 2b [Cryptotermes secundus]